MSIKMNETVEETLLIVGTGAMACLFAARLASIGLKITMLGTWEAGLKALNEHGVQLALPDGSRRILPVHAAASPAELTGVRYALVLVKSWQTQRAARQLEYCLAADGTALSLQNGLGNLEQLSKVLGSSRVALGVTTAGATLLEAGSVRPAGAGEISLAADPRLLILAGWLERAGFVVNETDDTRSLVWGKLIINTTINPLTAILGVQNGELLNRPSARHLMGATAVEGAKVADALGIRVPFRDVIAKVESVARDTAENRSSMLQDIRRGAPTEIDAINGAIVRFGEKLSIPTPLNRTLWQLVKALIDGTG